MLSPVELDALQRRLVEIDKLRVENATRLKSMPPHGQTYRDYQRQELECEASELLAERQRTADAIKRGTDQHKRFFRFPTKRHKPSPEAIRQRNALDLVEEEQRKLLLGHVRRCEQQSDFRQARLWRLQLIDLRQRIAREFGFKESA